MTQHEAQAPETPTPKKRRGCGCLALLGALFALAVIGQLEPASTAHEAQFQTAEPTAPSLRAKRGNPVPAKAQPERPLGSPGSSLAQTPPSAAAPVFPSPTGAPWTHRTLYRRFCAAAAAGGFPKSVHLKLLRTSYATWLADNGCNPKLHADLLGHTDISMTLKYYVQTDFQRAADFLHSLHPDTPTKPPKIGKKRS